MRILAQLIIQSTMAARMAKTTMPDQMTEIDRPRLRKQLEVMRDVMRSAAIVGTWLTLEELEKLTHYPQASISADLRHLRKKRNGAYVVEKRRRGGESSGLWEYKIGVKEPD